MARSTMVVLVICLGGLAACGDSDGAETASATTGEVAAATQGGGDVEAWCSGWPPPPMGFDTEVPGDEERAVEAMVRAGEALLEVAPPEIADASAILMEELREFQQAFEDGTLGVGPPPERDPAAEAADAQIAEFAAENC